MKKTVWLYILVCLYLIFVCWYAKAEPTASLKYRGILVREAHVVYGLDAPIPMFAGQIHQESHWRANVTAWDDGRGLAQFMDGTAAFVAAQYPELGRPDPYNPVWATRALVRLNAYNYARVKGVDECQRWGAALKGYNAGLGYVQQAQRKSKTPGVWFGATEYTPTRQSKKNFEYSRLYPRWIIFKHQPLYIGWGRVVCEGVRP